ncbi:unnamed protein product [Caenorhabditis angaria]|uniref:MAM domain-containing protein n=1 Tax=Caenorhabditis angaria TaxID=860376 RepID=A0A9P1MV50_9PELO|nr:unnamed protein product [Caenorhabditis angaria]
MSRSIIFLVFLGIQIFKVSSTSKLDCDFSGECCWATAREEDQWEIRSGDELDVNEFRRIFLTGKSRPPPSANYAIRVENKRKSSLISCAVCSSTGHATVKFRHWQSANAILRICWQLEGDGSPAPENCLIARHGKQSKLNVYRFKKIHKSQNFRLVFIVENADEKIENHEATVIIDKINVEYDNCEEPEVPKKPKHTISSINRHKTRSITPIKSHEKPKTVDEELKKIDKQIAQVVDQVNSKQVSTTSSPIKAAPTTAPVDPLTDLLGSKFVEFLDPNYESEDEPEDESDHIDQTVSKVSSTTVKPSPVTTTRALPIKRVETAAKLVDIKGLLPTTTPRATTPAVRIQQILPDSVLKYISRGKPLKVQAQNGVFAIPVHQPHQIPLGPPSTCTTEGGCLFESSFCSWKTPVGIQNKFHIKQVHMSSFAEAVVPSGEISIMETDTRMNKPHTVLFDSLEFSLGTRLIACCLSDGKLNCPFATQTEQTAIIWQFSKFECPANTSKIAFICENYGTADGICGVDNVRIHSSTDVFFLEPCQKDKL